MIKHRYNAVESIKLMGSAPNTQLGPEFQVLVWNVFKCKKQGWQTDFTRLTSDKDVILLQEAVLNSPFDALFHHSNKHQWVMASSFKHLKSNIETGVKTGASVTPSTQSCLASLHGEPITQTKKMLLATEYPLRSADPLGNEQSLLVINAHIINFVSLKKFRRHLDQVADLLRHHQGPILLAGDFNTWRPKRLAYFHHIVSQASLHQVQMTRQARFNHFFQHLDHVYCRGLDLVQVQVHTEIQSSDHYPISLSLRASA